MPEEWTREHSVAVLLVGMSMIDGEVDPDEMRSLIATLRDFPGIDPARSAAIGQEVYRELWERDEDDALIPTLQEHGRALATAYPRDTLREICGRLEAMAGADGQVHPMERRMLQAFRSAWGLDQPS